MTICEDDAIFNRNFPEGAAFLAGTAPTFDIILWGWNMDAALSVKIHGETPAAMAFDQDRMRSGLKHFQGRVIPSILLPLTQAMGLVCYTVSAAGAKKLRERCLPLRPFLLNLPLGRGRLRNVGLDVVLSALYEGMSAFACFPALVVTPNDHARSTTRPSNPPAAKAVDLE